jgi:hypothetical protein
MWSLHLDHFPASVSGLSNLNNNNSSSTYTCPKWSILLWFCQWELYMHFLFASCALSEKATLSVWKFWTYLCVWWRFDCSQTAYIWSTNLTFIIGKKNWRTQSGHISYEIIYWLMDVLTYIHRFLLSITVNNHIQYKHNKTKHKSVSKFMCSHS